MNIEENENGESGEGFHLPVHFSAGKRRKRESAGRLRNAGSRQTGE